MDGIRAVVLGIEHPRGVAVVRSLGRRGVRVVAVEHDPRARGLGSRYLERCVRVDDDPARTIAALEALGADGGGVLIPTNDRYLMLVSQHYDRLSRLFSISVPPWDVLEPLVNKPECYRLGQAAGLRTPRSFAPRDVTDLERILPSLDLDAQRYVLSAKLPGTVPVDEITGRMTTVAGDDIDTIRARSLAIAARTGDLPVIIEVIPGRSDRCVGASMVVDRDHAPVVAYCVRRLQLQLYATGRAFIHPYEMGANVYCESARDDEAVEAATRLVRHARFHGAITVEFRRDARDEGLTLVKADPRVVRATTLSEALGMDVSAALYDVFTGRRPAAATTYPAGVAWLWSTWYVDTVWANRHRAPLGAQLWAIGRKFHRIRAFTYLSLRDPRPALTDLARLLQKYGGSLRTLPERILRLLRFRARHRPASLPARGA